MSSPKTLRNIFSGLGALHIYEYRMKPTLMVSSAIVGARGRWMLQMHGVRCVVALEQPLFAAANAEGNA